MRPLWAKPKLDWMSLQLRRMFGTCHLSLGCTLGRLSQEYAVQAASDCSMKREGDVCAFVCWHQSQLATRSLQDASHHGAAAASLGLPEASHHRTMQGTNTRYCSVKSQKEMQRWIIQQTKLPPHLNIMSGDKRNVVTDSERCAPLPELVQ